MSKINVMSGMGNIGKALSKLNFPGLLGMDKPELKEELRFQEGDFVKLRISKEFEKLPMCVFFVDGDRVYAEIISKKKDVSYGMPMTGAFELRKKFSGKYLAGEHKEFDFDVEENLKRKKIDLKKIYGENNQIINALNSEDEQQRRYARESIIQQVFRKP